MAGLLVVISITLGQIDAISVYPQAKTLSFFVASRGSCRTFTRKATTEVYKCLRIAILQRLALSN
jgi:hypothetical protein